MDHSFNQTWKKKNYLHHIPSSNLTFDTILKYFIFSLDLSSATKHDLPHLH